MKIMTGYSFRHSIGHLQDVIDRLKVCEYPVAPISDFCSTFGFARWKKVCDKAKLRPMYGVTIPVSPSMEAKKPVTAEWTFFAMDNLSGINSLMELASSQFRYSPLLSYRQAMEAKDVLIIAGSNSLLNEFAPQGNLYCSLNPSTAKGWFNAAKAQGHQFVACCENRYPTPEDRFLYETILGRKKNTQSYPQYILARDEWDEAVKKAAPEVLDRNCAREAWTDFLESCRATLGEGSLLNPPKPQTLREICVANAPKLGIDLSDPVYAARLEREIELIYEKEFENYFYIVGDMVRYAKSQMMVGGGRGSSSGSLVCYLLEITTIDPIPYDLLFERFIDINRGGYIWNSDFKLLMNSICEE